MQKMTNSSDIIMMPHGCNWRWNFVGDLIEDNGWEVGCELGVKEGRFTNYLVKKFPNLSMTCVDLWDVQPDNDLVDGGEDYTNWDNTGHYNTFKHVMKQYHKRVIIHRMFTHEACLLVDDNSLDFVFIDADHSTKGVSRDIMNWKSKVKDTGAIIGHDYSWPTVQQAINQEFSDPSKVWHGYNNTWAIWRRDI